MSDLPPEIEQGFQDLEESRYLIDTANDDFGLADLDDLDGVGPATVRNLRDAGIRDVSDLYGLSQDEIASIDGIGPKTAANIRRQIAQQGNRIGNRGFGEDRIEKAEKIHAERSTAARRTDESFNAEIAPSFSQWKENPGRYDMPGVDTIPRERRLERTREAATVLGEAGALEEIDVTPGGPDSSMGQSFGSNTTGLATPATGLIEVAADQSDPESTLAHELGHIADDVSDEPGSLTRELFGPNVGEADSERQETLREQGAQLASRRREISMKPEWIEEQAEQGDFAGGGFNEIFADAFAEMVEEPRRAKSEAPDLYREIQSEFREQKDGFWTPF